MNDGSGMREHSGLFVLTLRGKNLGEGNMRLMLFLALAGMAVMLRGSLSLCAEEERPGAANAAGESEGSQGQSKPDEGNAEKRQLRAAQEHIKRLAMHVADESNDELKPVDRPLLAYGEPTRGNNHGTLWAFGAAGRPAAFMELWQASDNQTIWFQSLIRSGDQPLRLQSPDGKRWEPPRGPIDRLTLENAPRPAGSGPGRLRQLKSLAGRFAAHEIWDPNNSRHELRLLVQPVHRYVDAGRGVQDGAAFVFAHGTNPELIVLLEALGASIEQARWHYSAFPSSSAELHLEFDGREVWTRPRAPGVVGLPNDDYWLFLLPVESEPSSDEENSSADGDRTGASK